MTSLPDQLYVHRGVLARRACARLSDQVYAARAEWTPCFDGVQFTLGRAYYTHLEEDRAEDYFACAPASDALVERAVPGLQASMRAMLSRLLGEPVLPRPGWCGPGVHIFPAGAWLAGNGGDVHFDTEGLLGDELEARAPALSAVLMLQPPIAGGGLRVWDALYDGEDEVAEPDAIPSVVIDYRAGDLLLFDSYRLHQIQPFAGPRDRISVTAHAVQSTDGRWHAWF
jgi:hypothetical protein